MYSRKERKRVVTGVVTDAIDGEPLVGVNIVVKGQKSGTITDLNGRYSISVSGDKAVLVFSYIGYQKREAPVEDLGVVNVTMSGEQQTLNEVVVVGSGVQKESECDRGYYKCERRYFTNADFTIKYFVCR